MLIGIPVALVNGFAVDIFSRAVMKFNPKRDLRQAQIITCIYWFMANQILSLIMSIILCFKSVGWQTYLLVGISTIFRTILYSSRNIFCVLTIEKEIFGRILGIINLYGLVSALVMPSWTNLRNTAFEGNFLYQEYILIGVSIRGNSLFFSFWPKF